MLVKAGLTIATMIGAAGPVLGQCQPAWLAGEIDGDVNIPPLVSMNWDPDGPGPKPPVVVIGGEFSETGGKRTNHIAMWDGSHFLDMAGGIPPIEPVIRALAAWDPDGGGPADSMVIAGGNFDAIGGVTAAHIAAWDGSAWHALGAGLPVFVAGIAVLDPDGSGPLPGVLYATADTTFGEPGSKVFRWDGVNWIPIVSVATTGGSLIALASYDADGDGPNPPRLIAGGVFSSIDGVPANNIAQWDGTSWSAMGIGIQDTGGEPGVVLTMQEFDPDGPGPAPDLLIVGGQFGLAGGNPAGALASWNGSTWTGMADGLYPHRLWVNELDVEDPDGPGGVPGVLAVAAQYVTTGTSGSFTPVLAFWDGATWQKATLAGEGTINTVANWTDDLGAPGVFVSTFFNPLPGVTMKFGEWHHSALHGIGTAFDGQVRAFTRYPVPGSSGSVNPPVIAAGDSTIIGSELGSGLGYWDGRTWRPLGPGVGGGSPTILALDSADPDGAGPAPALLTIGGTFTTAGGVSALNIAQWDGTTWRAVAGGLNNTVRALLTCDPDGPGPIGTVLCAGGSFTTAGGASRFRIAYWNGTSWNPFAFGFADGSVTCLALFDVDGPGPLPKTLVAGGSFNSAAGVATAKIAYWDGANWKPLGTGMDGTVSALTVYDPDGPGPLAPVLVAGGSLGMAGGVAVSGAAFWNGSAWSLPGTFSVFPTNALTTYASPTGGPDVLIAAGRFFGGIKQFDGTDWSDLGTGFPALSPFVNALLSYDPDGAGPVGPVLLAGGSFGGAGGQVSVNTVRWAAQPAPWIALHPDRASILDPISTFTAEAGYGYAELPGGLAYQWYRNGVAIADGPGGASAGGGTVAGASGVQTLSGPVTLTISAATLSDAGQYSCAFSNSCGSAQTNPGELGPFCQADLNSDGVVDFQDYLVFLSLYDAADLRVDFNEDGIVDFQDYLAFLNLYDAGC